MAETKEILIQIQDIGRRLAGLNVELSASEALIEVGGCDDELDALTWLLTKMMFSEHGVEADSG